MSRSNSPEESREGFHIEGLKFLSVSYLNSNHEGNGWPNSSATSVVVIIVPNNLFKISSLPIFSSSIRQLVSEMIVLCIKYIFF